MDNKKNLVEANSKFWFLIIGICIVLLVVVLISIVSFANRKEKIYEKKVNGGSVELKYFNKFQGIEVVNLTPLTDSLALADDSKDNYIDFSVDTSLDEAAHLEYELSLMKDPNKSSISNDDIRIALEKEVDGEYQAIYSPSEYKPINNDTEIGSKAGSMVLTKVNKAKKSTDNYRLKIWLSDKSAKSVGSFKAFLKINAKAS